MNKENKLNFIPIAVGLCFFFNPYFSVIDLLPDFIGCLLIAFGLVQTARIHTHMRHAQRAFLILALIDFIKSMLLLFVFTNSAMGEQETLVLIVAFLSATLGTLCAVVAMRALFDGIDWVAASLRCEALYAVKRNGRSRTELLCRHTVFFVIFKEILLLLPEFAALLNSTYVDSDLIRIYDYIGIMRLLAIIPVLIVGIWWLIEMLAYFVRLHREREFLRQLGERYATYMEAHPGIRIRARYALAFLLIGIGTLFFTDFYLDYRNIIPDALGGVLLFAGILLLGLPKKLMIPTALTAALYVAIAALSSNRAYLFMREHIGADITRSEAVAVEYQAMWLVSLGEMLCFLVLLLLLLLCLRAVVMKWGGYRPEHADADFEERHRKKIHDEFDWQLIKCYIFGFLSALLSFLFDYLKTWPDTVKLRYFARLMEALWIPDFLLGLFFAVYVIYTLTQLMQGIQERFRFE